MQATADATTAALSRIGTGAGSPALGNISNNFNTVINNLFNNQRINNITDSFNDLSRTTFNSQYIGAVNNTANAVYNYGRALGQATENVQRHANHTRTLFHRLATTVGQFYILYMAVKKVANIYAEWYTKSNDFIENLNLFEVTMRSSTNAALDYAKNVERIMGIDLADWLNYQGKFQQLSKGFGVASEQADIMSKNLTQLSYDLSSFFNVDAQKAFEKLSSAMAGQVKGLREYGIDVTVASLQQYALSKGIDLTVRNMTQAQKAVLRYNYILEKTVNIQGDMARTIITPANSLRILNAQLERLKRTLGNIISVVVTKFIPYVQAGVNLITKFAERVANAFGFELPKIDYSGLDDAVSITEDMDDAASNLSDDFADAAAEAKKLKYQLMGFDELNILKSPTDDSTASKVEDNLANLYPSDLGLGIPEYDFGLDSVSLKADEILNKLKEAFNNLYENSGAKNFVDEFNYALKNVNTEQIRENFTSIAKDSAEIAKNVAPSVIETNKAVGAAGGAAAGLGATIGGKLTEIGSGAVAQWLSEDKLDIIERINSILGKFTSGFENVAGIFRVLGVYASKFFDIISPYVTPALVNILRAIEWALGGIGEAMGREFQRISRGALNILAGMPGFISGVRKNVLGFIDGVKQWFSDLWSNISTGWHTIFDPWGEILTKACNLVDENFITPVKEWFSGLWGGVSDGADGAWEGVKGAFSGVADWFKNAFSEAWKKVQEVFSSGGKIFEGIKEGVSRAFTGVVNSLIDGLNNIVGNTFYGLEGTGVDVSGFFSGLWDNISGFFSGVGDWFTDVWENISGFFSGIGDWFAGIWENVSGFFNGVGEWFSNLWAKVSNGWHIVFDPWIENLKRAKDWVNTNVITPITDFFKGLWQNVSGFFENLWNDITNIWNDAPNWFNENVIEPVANFFSGIWENISKGATEAWKGIQDAFSGVAEWFGNIFEEAWKKVQNIFSATGEIFNDIQNGVANAFATVINSLIDGMNSSIAVIFYNINSVFDTLREFELFEIKPFYWLPKVDPPQIPKISGSYASGGFPEMGEYFLARESGPEMVGRIGNQNTVANNDQIVTAVKQGVYEAVMSAQQQGTANTNQPASYDVDYITLGGDILLKSFVRAHNNYVYATGQSPLKMKRGD